MPNRSVAVLKITLDHVEPKVMRRIVVPADIRLDRNRYGGPTSPMLRR